MFGVFFIVGFDFFVINFGDLCLELFVLEYFGGIYHGDMCWVVGLYYGYEGKLLVSGE